MFSFGIERIRAMSGLFTATYTPEKMNRNPNIIGRKVAKLRFQRGWTLEMLAARLQVRGVQITRQIIANIEIRRRAATDRQVLAFAEVFGVGVGELFLP
jgi:hypothetical protein